VAFAIDVRLSMIDDVMGVVVAQPDVREERIGVNSRTRFDLLADMRLKMPLIATSIPCRRTWLMPVSGCRWSRPMTATLPAIDPE
jgi:hypothetical protein